MFDFDIDYLFEGEQADAYKAKKEQEKKDNENFGKERFTTNHGTGGHLHQHSDGHIERQYNTGNKMTKENPNNKFYHPIKRKEGKEADSQYQKKIEDRYMKPNENGEKRSQSWHNSGKYADDINTSRYTGNYQRDAIARHERRHPSKESMLEDLMENDIQFIDIMNEDI